MLIKHISQTLYYLLYDISLSLTRAKKIDVKCPKVTAVFFRYKYKEIGDIAEI